MGLAPYYHSYQSCLECLLRFGVRDSGQGTLTDRRFSASLVPPLSSPALPSVIVTHGEQPIPNLVLKPLSSECV